MSQKSNLQEEWLICAYGAYYYGILTHSFFSGLYCNNSNIQRLPNSGYLW